LVIKDELIKHFSKLDNLLIYEKLKDRLNRVKNSDIDSYKTQKKELDTKFKELFYNEIPLIEINRVIKDELREDFEIEFNIRDSKIEDKKLIYPEVILQIKDVEDRGDFKNHFNEAKLKLISIAIYFSLAKKFEIENSNLKLLVLDDFLTSLDMANRKFIMQYIFKNFKDYQIIIFTHNLQFYNLISKLLNMRNENSNWDIKNIFLRDDNEALIYDKEENYLKKAKKELLKGEFHISGNFLRKEFERIINEFKQILELGKIEQLNNILEILKSNTNENKFYKKPFNLLNKLNNRYLNIENIINNSENINAKIGKIRFEIKQIKNISKINECEFINLKNLLTNTEFYKNIFFNSASHSNEEIEIYRKECVNSIKLMEEIDKILKSLK